MRHIRIGWLVALLLVTAAPVVVAPAAGGQTPAPTYAALGDSYSSGEGAAPYDVAKDPCKRAAAAWPRQLATATARPVAHVACSGAKTAQLLGPWTSRNLPAQIPAASDPNIRLVTVTIGGNDVGFGDIVSKCVTSTCPSATSASFTTALATMSRELTRNTGVYARLKLAYPAAKIVHVGYPRLTPAPGKPASCLWLSRSEQTTAAAIVDQINATIKAAAELRQITYVDVTNAFSGHEMCTGQPWVRPILSEGQAHPNASGQLALANVLRVAVG